MKNGHGIDTMVESREIGAGAVVPQIILIVLMLVYLSTALDSVVTLNLM
ncbi:hypothetical protein HID58_048775 [Brassica napus]|uniref:Uncharacterized protein n=1 Tax=Brassica napus TaxID=3708 RepID=A0ABQ8B346_BRANA|nr:hypothetical protein HID58_048775 [Brassica napus]